MEADPDSGKSLKSHLYVEKVIGGIYMGQPGMLNAPAERATGERAIPH